MWSRGLIGSSGRLRARRGSCLGSGLHWRRGRLSCGDEPIESPKEAWEDAWDEYHEWKAEQDAKRSDDPESDCGTREEIRGTAGTLSNAELSSAVAAHIETQQWTGERPSEEEILEIIKYGKATPRNVNEDGTVNPGIELSLGGEYVVTINQMDPYRSTAYLNPSRAKRKGPTR